ncbi:serine/threonine-protein kinase [Streptomyces sp. WAC06614]|uniref:serine/threonine-protein kinase n=1 Tax=Streptomyces sp. WAC06614 TaxID=2487416 RepID=UPI00163C461B|nr:serine/threonine-protein kinase [Streptomyces sp. WAC06614]
MENGELIAGRYELVKRLGRGGMGEVWAARDRSLHRDVAVKMLVLDHATVPELAQRFEREAVAAAQINHPNVAAMYDRGTHEDVLYLVMEKVDGRPLSEYVRAGQPLPLAEALALAEGICTALVAAHRAGVVHYDIKPHNVMLTAEHEVKVVDFGIAGFLQTAFATLARSSQLTPAGTAEYGAPEQFLSARGDERSDLYALGSVLFTLLTGRPPFTGHHPLAVIRQKLDEDAPRLATVRPGLPPELAALVAELLARDPAGRPASARGVRERLQALRGPAGAGTGQGSRTGADAAAEADAERHVLLGRFAQAARTVVARPARIASPRRFAPPEQPPALRTVTTFQTSWTGREPLRAYGASELRPVHLLGLGGCAAGTALALGGAIAVGMFVLAVGLAFVVGTLLAAATELHYGRVRGKPWGLEVGPHGITITDAAQRRHLAWSGIQRVAVEEIQGRQLGRFTGLHIDPAPEAPLPAVPGPAGWPYAKTGMLTQRPSGRVALAVLGPLSKQQRKQLIDTLVEHGGSRWVPAHVFTTPPR